MRYKFNPYERAVGLFITVAIGGSVFMGAGLAVKKNWFEEKVSYTTYIHTAENLREGSSVLMSGLKVGKIDKIKLDHTQNIKVTFTVLKEYSSQITNGSKVQFIRPFVIGDKALTLIQGPPGGEVIAAGEVLPVIETFDLLEVLSGKKLEQTLAKVENILNNLDDTMALSKGIIYEVGDKNKIKKTMESLHFTMAEVRKIIPHLSSQVPAASQHVAKTIENLSAITTALREIQPEGSEKAIELLSESVITLKGIQKNYFLRSNVEEVKEELANKEKATQQNRLPASK